MFFLQGGRGHLPSSSSGMWKSHPTVLSSRLNGVERGATVQAHLSVRVTGGFKSELE